ncbi:tRNA-dihydrouridine(20a/20b) synthase [NAD(P)+]-like [Episyrphus balteatus]|uniref:tRNA-dihydrouridine(20a/20b) synthase [NAD(P)+]-like n=1 Tax=Episyrphus balteatus TaxID=286459 RepID=UPI00248693F1|nr:tRNA-dihydrouridine(20a/20b) synthase [NAD(P)+]-like [Episyrphus balteatus]
MTEFQNITQLFQSYKEQNKYVNVAAPMVRYSKLEFRRLLRQNNVKLCFTPMIVANSFNHSQQARLSEFSTNKDDRPLIAQFASHNSLDMLAASELVSPYVDGVDLNCGCPQSWATAKGYGCALLRKPELVEDIVKTLRRNFPSSFSVSIKLRLLQGDIRSTIDLCRQLETCGATFLVIHGRTQWQKTSHPVDVTAMSEIKKSIQIPLIVNGNVKTTQDADELYQQTKADGVMAARGLLSNPSLFTGTTQTTIECLQQWLDIANAAGDDLSFQCLHHHLTFMWGKLMRRRRRVIFNNFSTKEQVFSFFDEHYGIRPREIDDWVSNMPCEYPDYIAAKYYAQKTTAIETYRDGREDGTFFKSFRQKVLDVEGSSMNGDAEDDRNDLFFQNGSIFDL